MTVYLIGAGPGDPELVTVRGARLLATAEVVVFDRLARPLLALANAEAELIDVGKAPGSAPVAQHEINRLLIEHGRARTTVVRLKGGDPFVFARGAEEAMALIDAGVDFVVVPGITSALAAPAAAGVPLTVRGDVRSFTVLTGHEDPDAAPPGYWEALVAIGGSIVILMGSARIEKIAKHLLAAGLAEQTPAIAVHAATTPHQTVHRSSLGRIGELSVAPPTTFVIGAAAGLVLDTAEMSTAGTERFVT